MNKTLTPLFIIPARGGSKGIPRKNIRLLCGRPLIDYTIRPLLDAGVDTEHIVLSTDDAEIAEVGRSLGLAVDYMRPAHLATDTAGSREVMIDAMDWAESRGIAYDVVVLLQPTSPLRTYDDIQGALQRYAAAPIQPDMVVSVCACDDNPYYNIFETDPATGVLHISKGDGLYTRRQDAPKVWKYNGAVYVINPQSLRAMPLGAFPCRLPYEMDASRSVDLDTLEQWAALEHALSE